MSKSIIQRMLIVLTLLFGAMSASSATDRFYIDAVNIEPGETKQLAFMLENTQEFFGFQADITLPEGLEFVKANGKADFKLSSRADASYNTVSNLLANGSLRIGAFSTTHTAFSGNSGALMYANVHASESFTGGALAMSGIMFVNSSDNDVSLPDFTIELGTKHNDRFYIPDFKIAVGETKTISVVLDNETPFTAFQTDLYLPEGLNIVADSFKLTSRGSSSHTVSAKSFTDGRTRIICLSLSNDVFTGNSGALLDFDITATKDVAETAVVEMKNQIFSMANAREYMIPDSRTTVTTERALVESITLDQTSLAMVVGDSRIITATVLPTFASTKDVDWTSANPAVATVSQTGSITAVGIGQTTITATAVDGSGVAADCEVSVSGIPVTDIMLNRTSATLKATDTVQLTATVSPANASDKSLTWESSDTAVATVDVNGKVTAVAVGNAVITATSVSDPEISAECGIEVIPTNVSSIMLNQTSVSLQVGATFTFTADVLPETATNKGISWSSDDAAIASIDENGVVTAHSLGKTTITATADDGSGVTATAAVDVVPTPAESITIDKTGPIELKATQTIRLTATVGPEDATDKSVVWSSSDNNVASVDATGFVTAKAVGECEIIAANSAMQTASVSVSVIPTLAETITVIPSQISLRVGQTSELAATVIPETTTDKSIRWSSSDTDIVAVLEDGQIKALSLGEVIIRATAVDGSDVYGECKVIVEPTPVTAVSIVYDGSKSLYVGDSAQLSIEVTPDDATDKTIRWQVQNANVLSVDENGLLTAVGLGEAWVSATAASGVSHYMVFQVVPTPVSSINLTPSDVTLRVGDTALIEAEVLPADATDKEIYWSSLNPSVASVNNEGLVTANSLGSADILAAAADGNDVQAICKVTVEPTPATGIKIEQAGPIHIKVGETLQLTAVVSPADATDKTITWSSDAPESVSVDSNGLITCHALGVLKITATNSAGISDFVEVEVQNTLAEGLSLNRSTASLKVGNTIRLEPIFTPATTTDQTVSWSSSDPGIASVTEDGTVLAIALGECEIACRSLDGSDLTAICSITVRETAAESVTITPRGPFTLNIGQSVQLTATVGPETTTDKSVSWMSQTSAVSIDPNGLVTGIAPVENNWIKATNSAGQDDVVYVTVLPTMVSAIKIDKSSLELRVGESAQISAAVEPDDATDKSLVWESDNTEIATVDNYGNIFAKALGNVSITVTAKDGSGISASISVAVVPTPATGIEIIEPETTRLKVSQTLRLTAIVTPDDATDRSVIWNSDNTDIATVDANGTVIAVGVGNVTITAANSSGQKASIQIVVEPTVAQSLVLTNTDINMHIGEEIRLEARISPATTTDKRLKWTSSNHDIVSIDDTGKATAIALGEATIEAATTDGSNLTAICQVSVHPIAVEQVVIDYEGPTTLKVGDKVQLHATVLPENATDKSIEWVSQTAALSVDQTGLVTAHGIVEQSWIGAFSPASPYGDNPPADYKVDLIFFNVVPTLVERIDIVKDNDMMQAGETKQLSVIIYPESATDRSVVWESSDPTVISVDADGLLTAHQAGYADIKATAADGSEVFATTRIYVAVTPVESITITANGPTELKDGETLQLIATVYPQNATDKSIRWQTNAPYRATVDENGLVTAHSDIGVLDIWAFAGDASDKIMLTIVETPVEQVLIHIFGASTAISDGEGILAEATVLPSTATDKTITWSSSDEAVLRITDNGDGTCMAYGIAPGSAYLIATTSNGISESIAVEVKPILVESILLPEKLTLEAGQYHELIPEITPDNASIKDLSWSSSDLSVGEMNGNIFCAYSQGETTVTCRSTDGSDLSASCVITVVRYATSITLSEHDVTLQEGDSFAFTAEIQPIDATYKDVMWSSSDENVVTVSQTGVIEAISEGEAVVAVHTLCYPWLSDECHIRVDKYTGIETISIDDVRIQLVDRTVFIRDVALNTKVSLFTLDGQLLHSMDALSPALQIDLETAGVYIVKIGKYALKLVVR